MKSATFNIVKKELLYMIREPKAIIFELILPLINFFPIILTVWYIEKQNGIEVISQALGTSYVNNYYIVVLLSFVFFNMAETPEILLETELRLGTLEQIMYTPTNIYSMIKGWYLFSLIKTLGYIFVFIFFSLAFADIKVMNIPLIILLISALLIQAYGFGIIIQSITIYMRQAEAVISTLMGIIPIISCISYPISVFPKWIQIISLFFPTTYLFDMLKYAFSGSKLLLPIVLEMMLLFVSTLGLFVFSISFYKKFLRRAKECGIMTL